MESADYQEKNQKRPLTYDPADLPMRTHTGYLAILDAKDGRVIEKHFLNAEGKPGDKALSLNSPIIANSRLYVGSETGGIRCFAGGKIVE